MINTEGLRQRLVGAGFSALEAKVYLNILIEPDSKISAISRRSGVSRTQLYPLIRKMMGKGYVTKSVTNSGKFNSAEPSVLMASLASRREEEAGKINALSLELDALKPVKPLDVLPYEIKVVRGERNIIGEMERIVSATSKEIVSSGSFSHRLINKYPKLLSLCRSKAKKGVKSVSYMHVDPGQLGEFENYRKDVIGTQVITIIGERPYNTYVFDRKVLLLVFYSEESKSYDNAFVINSPILAEYFAVKFSSPVMADPVEGRVSVDLFGSKLSGFILPSGVLNSLPEGIIYKIGYNAGKFLRKEAVEKGFSSEKHTHEDIELGLKVAGWGKASCYKRGKRLFLKISNLSVPRVIIDGVIKGVFSDRKFTMVHKKTDGYSIEVLFE